MTSAAAARVAYAYATVVGGLVPDDLLSAYETLVIDNGWTASNVAADLAASALVLGSNGVYASKTVQVVSYSPALYAGMDVGNGTVRLTVACNCASTASSAGAFGSTWNVGPATSFAADLGTGVVTSEGGNGTSATLVALRTYPNVVLQTLTLAPGDGNPVSVSHTLAAPPAGFGVAFAANTFATPTSNVGVRAVAGGCAVGTVASRVTSEVRARAAYVGASATMERLSDDGASYTTTFELTPPASVSVLVAHGLDGAAAVRILGAAADDLASGALLPAHVVAETARTRFGVAPAPKAAAASIAELADDVNFHRLQLDAAVRAVADASPSDVGLDADMWVVPALLLLRPESARPFIEARVAALPGAREAARERGFAGACFLPPELANPYADAQAPLPLYRTGLAACAAWDFFRVTRDAAWLRETGYPLLRDVADFFVGAVRNNASIPRVTTPEGGVSDDDAFTNAVAFLAVRAALESSYELGFAGKPAWQALVDAEDAFGKPPLLAGSTTKPTWPLRYTPPVSYLAMATPTTTATLASAAFYAIRAQEQSLAADQLADVRQAHAITTALLRDAAKRTRPWGVVRDPALAGAYVLLFLTAYAGLEVEGGINQLRYQYAPYGVPLPARTGAVFPPHFESIAVRTGTDAGAFLITNQLTFP